MAKKHILVVANDKTTCQGLVNQLKEVGYDGAIAVTSQEAKDRLREARPDAILMGLDGEGVDENLLGELRSEGDYSTSAPVVVLANKGSESAALSAIDVGADDLS